MNAEIKTHFEAYINDVDFDVEAEYLPNFAKKAPAFRHRDESARQTWRLMKTLL